ncbi:hypothetical protein O0D86_11645 [Staphylococcus pseudintermedius]|nr:hypothetical protein [Staphylococcus pseudintermedius]EGQ3889168.1 hypothetical protein [Staphylococcus pseudintermedius]EKI4485063.1 hypothetical protein [Staphylococcus pseudintermedius]MDK3891033.1 hypothetical protein [Staphylococcus pseudintermedius]
MLSPQLQLYNKVFKRLLKYGAPVIDVKDIGQTLPYPFFVVQRMNVKKSFLTFDRFSSQATVLIHVWSVADDESVYDAAVSYAESVVSTPIELDGYDAMPDNIDTRFIADKSTNQLLNHTVITADYKIY